MELKRGEIYYLTFPYTLDPKYPNGKPKFVLVLQEGEYFQKWQEAIDKSAAKFGLLKTCGLDSHWKSLVVRCPRKDRA